MTVVASYGMVLCGNSDDVHQRYRGRIEKVKFGVPINEAFSHDIPATLLVLLLKVNKEGPLKKDIWRAPGNQAQVRKLSHIMQHGRLVNIANFSVYTAASVIKKFLSKLPGGIFGLENEQLLFNSVSNSDPDKQRQVFCNIFSRLPLPSQHLLVLLFGTFRMVADGAAEFGTKMTPEAIGISVAPSLFHSCIHEGQKVKVEDVERFKLASQVVSNIIKSFGHTTLFPRECYEFYARITGRTLRYDQNTAWIFNFQYPSIAPETSGSSERREQEPLSIEITDENERPGTSRTMPPLPTCPELTCTTKEPLATTLDRILKQPINQRLSNRLSCSVGEVLSASAEAELCAVSPSSLISIHGDSTRSLSILDSVHEMQARRMESRSQWFLSPNLSRNGVAWRREEACSHSQTTPVKIEESVEETSDSTLTTKEKEVSPTKCELRAFAYPTKTASHEDLSMTSKNRLTFTRRNVPMRLNIQSLEDKEPSKCNSPGCFRIKHHSPRQFQHEQFQNLIKFWDDKKLISCRSTASSCSQNVSERVPFAEKREKSLKQAPQSQWPVASPEAALVKAQEERIAGGGASSSQAVIRRRSWRTHYVRPTNRDPSVLGGGSLDNEDRPVTVVNRGVTHAQSFGGERCLVDSPNGSSGGTPSRKRSLKKKMSTKF